jgi:hypothetical protein
MKDFRGRPVDYRAYDILMAGFVKRDFQLAPAFWKRSRRTVMDGDSAREPGLGELTKKAGSPQNGNPANSI